MNALSTTEQLTVDLLAAAHRGEAAPRISADQWPAVLKELSDQAVLAAPADAVESLDLPAQERDHYLSQVASYLMNWYQLMAAQDQVLQLFRAQGVPVAVLKGSAAAMNYPQPQRRAMGDIDLIVKLEDFSRAADLLVQQGWDRAHESPSYDRHVGFEKPGCPEIELHRYFSSSHNEAQNQVLDDYVIDGISHAEMADMGGYQVPVLPPFANGLVLIGHINQHLSGGLGLRQIMDWQMFAEQHLDAVLAQEFEDALEQIGMRRLAVAASALCNQYLGGRIPRSWSNVDGEDLAEELLLYTLRQGNMGRKSGDVGSRNTQTVLHNFRNPVTAVRYLRDGGRAHWPLAARHAWLAPAACVYQVGHLARKGFARKASLEDLRRDAAQSHQDVAFLEKLGVTRI